jgi:hypothetical protein
MLQPGGEAASNADTPATPAASGFVDVDLGTAETAAAAAAPAVELQLRCEAAAPAATTAPEPNTTQPDTLYSHPSSEDEAAAAADEDAAAVQILLLQQQNPSSADVAEATADVTTAGADAALASDAAAEPAPSWGIGSRVSALKAMLLGGSDAASSSSSMPGKAQGLQSRSVTVAPVGSSSATSGSTGVHDVWVVEHACQLACVAHVAA